MYYNILIGVSVLLSKLFSFSVNSFPPWWRAKYIKKTVDKLEEKQDGCIGKDRYTEWLFFYSVSAFACIWSRCCKKLKGNWK